MSAPDSDRSPLEDLLAADDVVMEEITAEELDTILGGNLLDVLNDLLANGNVELRLPRRGTDEYRQMLEDGASTTGTRELVSGLGNLWNGYGWRGILDFQTLLIRRIAHLAPDLTRDADGYVRLGRILRLEHNETELLETAVHLSNDPPDQDSTLGLSRAFDMGQRLQAAVESWVPGFQQALNAACEGDTNGIRPVLARLPGLRDEAHQEATTQCTFVLALAHLVVSQPEAALRAMP